MSQPVSTIVTLDRERNLRMDYDAIEFIAGLSNADKGGDRSPLDLWRLASGMDPRAMAVMICACSRHEDSTVTVQSTRRALKHAIKVSKVTTWKKINDALEAAVKQSDQMGIFSDGDAEDDEDASGNAQRPSPGTTTAPMTGEHDSPSS